MELLTEPGSLLLSMPQLMDENFMHTVVLMVEHTPDGAYGLVVNRPAAVTIDQLMPDHPVLSQALFPVYSGGPVGLDTLQFIHRVPNEIPGGLQLYDDLYMGGEFESLASHISREGGGGDVRLFLGYSGWGAGQLDAELATGSWVPAPPRPEVEFLRGDPERTWRETMRALGSDGEGLSHQPPDPSWN